jgi:hypothetical protein
MNSLTLGFVYVTGVSWLLCETCVSASNGNWMPLILFTIFFILMFAILGCVKISDRAVEMAGPVFSILTGLGIFMYAFASFGDSVVGGLLRVIGAAFMIVLGVLAFSYVKSDSESGAH